MKTYTEAEVVEILEYSRQYQDMVKGDVYPYDYMPIWLEKGNGPLTAQQIIDKFNQQKLQQ